MASIHALLLDSGQTRRFDQDRIVIGRDPSSCDWTVDESEFTGVSKEHAAVSLDDGSMLLEDLDSANGVYVNGQRVEGRQILREGDEIRLGPQGPKFRCSDRGITSGGGKTTLLTSPAQLQQTGRKQGIGMQTLQTKLAETTRQERVRTRLLLVAVVLLLGSLAGWAAWAAWQQGQRADALQEDLAARDRSLTELMGAIATQDELLRQLREDSAMAEEERAKRIAAAQAELDELRGTLHEAQEQLRAAEEKGNKDWASTAKAYEESIFLCVVVDPETRKTGIGTGFVVHESGLLATNAHVVKLLEGPGIARIIQNGTGKVFPLEATAAHPAFRGATSPDVGLIKLKFPSGITSLKPMPLATADQLAAIRVGSHLGTIGFPGELQREYLRHLDHKKGVFEGAVATFKDGWVGRLTAFDGKRAATEDQVLIQHSASLSGGTSGSPMFLIDGTVVAVSNSSVSMQLSSRNKQASLLSASEIAFAIRIDVLRDFAERVPWAKGMLGSP